MSFSPVELLCEGQHMGVGGLFGSQSTTEFASLFAAVPFVALAFMGLMRSHKTASLTKSSFAVMMCTGLASMLFHATNYKLFALLDRCCAVLLACITLLLAIDETFREHHDTVHPRATHATSAVLFVLTLAYTVTVLVFGALNVHIDPDLLLLFPLVGILVLLVCLHVSTKGPDEALSAAGTGPGPEAQIATGGSCSRRELRRQSSSHGRDRDLLFHTHSHKPPQAKLGRLPSARRLLRKESINRMVMVGGDTNESLEIYHMLWRGVVTFLLSGLFYMIDRLLCNDRVVWMFGHAIAHLLAGFGVFDVLCFLSYMRSKSDGLNPTLTWQPTHKVRLLPKVEIPQTDRLRQPLLGSGLAADNDEVVVHIQGLAEHEHKAEEAQILNGSAAATEPSSVEDALLRAADVSGVRHSCQTGREEAAQDREEGHESSGDEQEIVSVESDWKPEKPAA